MHAPKVTSLLIERLEHIAADSIWAHRASGVRRSLIRILELAESGQSPEPQASETVHALGYRILEGAAREKRINRIQRQTLKNK